MYKELAAELRLFETVCKHSDKPDLADLVGRAANAIEELQKKYDGAVSDNKSLCRQIAELAKERNEAYSKGLLEGGIAQRAEDEKWMPKWIPVTDRLPECEWGAEVGNIEWISCGMIFAGCFGRGGKYRDEYFRTWTDGTEGIDIKGADYWRPIQIPEPPKEE